MEVHRRNGDSPELAAIRHVQLVCPQTGGPPHLFPHLPVVDMQAPAGRLDCCLTFPVAPAAVRAQAALKNGFQLLGQFDEALRHMAALFTAVAVTQRHHALDRIIVKMLPRHPQRDWHSAQLDTLLRSLRHVMDCYEEAWEVYILQPSGRMANSRSVDLEAWSQLPMAFREWSAYCQGFLARSPVVGSWSSSQEANAPARLVQLWLALHTQGTSVSERADAYAPPGATSDLQVAHQLEHLMPNVSIAWASVRGRAGVACPGAELFEWVRAFWRMVHKWRGAAADIMAPIIALEALPDDDGPVAEVGGARAALSRWTGHAVRRTPSFDKWVHAIEQYAQEVD